ncbi:hypothetical protein EX30DRAFT_387145 [Ascodesmis nigricans]|uniref:Uncharacterized protein n=1 Tax=Ascodesmis nigricans TaxID=341454 RepID=A0A4V3SHU6_9PEZI|nr:hypothetical protein EX30DRAFT_387145 [Ascodesmis nigricans]
MGGSIPGSDSEEWLWQKYERSNGKEFFKAVMEVVGISVVVILDGQRSFVIGSGSFAATIHMVDVIIAPSPVVDRDSSCNFRTIGIGGVWCCNPIIAKEPTFALFVLPRDLSSRNSDSEGDSNNAEVSKGSEDGESQNSRVDHDESLDDPQYLFHIIKNIIQELSIERFYPDAQVHEISTQAANNMRSTLQGLRLPDQAARSLMKASLFDIWIFMWYFM